MVLNERVLRLILALAEELHFRRASARLHLSQPALSGTVKALERDLGVRLFIRTSRNVQLTEAGQVLVAEARHLLEQNDRAIALVRASCPDVMGPLRIGYSSSVDLQWLAALIRRARRANFPADQFQFVSAEAPDLRSELVKGKLQAALLTGTQLDPDLETVALFREDFAVAVGPRHKWARLPALQIDRLRDQPLIWLRRDVNPLLHDSVIAQLTTMGCQPRMSQEVSTYFECLQFAHEGLGITFVPVSMKSRVHEGTVAFLRLGPRKLQIECALAYLRGVKSTRLNRLVQFVQAQVPHGKLAS